jgi:hypothetical protein
LAQIKFKRWTADYKVFSNKTIFKIVHWSIPSVISQKEMVGKIVQPIRHHPWLGENLDNPLKWKKHTVKHQFYFHAKYKSVFSLRNACWQWQNTGVSKGICISTNCHLSMLKASLRERENTKGEEDTWHHLARDFCFLVCIQRWKPPHFLQAIRLESPNGSSPSASECPNPEEKNPCLLFWQNSIIHN